MEDSPVKFKSSMEPILQVKYYFGTFFCLVKFIFST